MSKVQQSPQTQRHSRLSDACTFSELLALMHFLQPDKYDLLEQDFDLTDEDKEAKIRELHTQLKDIMLRRLKKDVVKSLPTKSERILRVEMSQMQVWWYKNILSRVSAEYNTTCTSLPPANARASRIIQHLPLAILKYRYSTLLWSSRRHRITHTSSKAPKPEQRIAMQRSRAWSSTVER